MKYPRLYLIIFTVFYIFNSNGLYGAPYSANGIGDLFPDNYGRSQGMGGAGIANDDGLNILDDNPALLGGFKKNSFILGADYNNTNTNISGFGNVSSGKTNPDFLKIILPIYKRIVLGWSLRPYSRTDASLNIPSNQDSVNVIDHLSSSGGVNVSSFGIATSFKDIIRLGYSLNYNFGMIEEDWTRRFPSDTDTVFTKSTFFMKRKYSGYNNTFGLQVNLFKKIGIGAGYTSKGNLEYKTYAISGLYTDPEVLLSERTLYLPATFRAGVCYNFNQKLKAAADYGYSWWEKAADTVSEKKMYSNTRLFGAGLRYVKSDKILDSYWNRIPVSIGYSFGDLYYKSYPKINTVSQKSVSVGFEFPLKGNSGSVMTSFEYGVRGNKSQNGWKDNFFNFGLIIIGSLQ